MRDDKHRELENGNENEYDRKHRKPEPKKKKKKKKRRRHHFFLWIVLLVLIIGILLGLLIDRGIIGFPGGEGWIGGAIGTITNRGQDDGEKPVVTEGANVTPITTPGENDDTPTGNPNKAYITVHRDYIDMNGVKLEKNEDIIDQLNTDRYKNCTVYIIDEYATRSLYKSVTDLLDKNKIRYKEIVKKEE